MPKKAAGVEKSGRSPQDLFTILKSDHRKVQGLFQRILKSHKRSDDVFAQIKEELDKHMRAEEKHFYPALEQEKKAREYILEAYEEHEIGKELLEKTAEPEDDEHWLARVKVLSDLVDHHIEEEEGQVFRQARRLLGKQRAQEIARMVLEEEGRTTEAVPA